MDIRFTGWNGLATAVCSQCVYVVGSVVPMLPRSLWLALVPCLRPLIQRLQNSRVDGRDHIYRRVQFIFGHPRFPCVRKAPLHSWIPGLGRWLNRHVNVSGI
jgi:hypothetical protein